MVKRRRFTADELLSIPHNFFDEVSTCEDNGSANSRTCVLLSEIRILLQVTNFSKTFQGTSILALV